MSYKSFERNYLRNSYIDLLSKKNGNCQTRPNTSSYKDQLHDLHRLDELKNFAANILLKLVIKSCTGIRAIG